MLFSFKYTIFCSRTFRNRQKVATTFPEIFSGTQQHIEVKQERLSCLSSETECKERSCCFSLVANSSFLLPPPLRSMGYLSRSGGRKASPTTVLGFGGLHVPGLWVRLIVLKKPQFLNISMLPC